MVAGGFGFNHYGLARRVQPRQKNSGFHLSRRDGNLVAYGYRVVRTNHRHGQTPACASHGLRAKESKRVGHACHGPPVERRIARKCRGDGRGRHGPDDKPHAGSRIPAVDDLLGLGEATDANTFDGPVATTVIGHFGAKSAHGLGRVQHILTFQQSRNLCFSDA